MTTQQAEVNGETHIDGVKVLGFEDLNVKDPKPGIYRDIPFDIYSQIDALNSSKIRQACESMRHYKRYLIKQDGEKDESYALEYGKAFAKLCEDPSAIGNSIQPAPTKTFPSVAWIKALEENPGVIYVKESDIPMLEEMANALREHQYTKRFMHDVEVELTVVWVCQITGALCKARIDIYRGGDVIDVKTTAKIHPDKLKWSIRDYKYDVQLCFYMDGMKTLGTRAYNCTNFFVEKNAILPDVVVWIYNDEELNEARNQYVEAIRAIQESEKTGEFPGYAPEPIMNMFGFDEPTQTFE